MSVGSEPDRRAADVIHEALKAALTELASSRARQPSTAPDPEHIDLIAVLLRVRDQTTQLAQEVLAGGRLPGDAWLALAETYRSVASLCRQQIRLD